MPSSFMRNLAAFTETLGVDQAPAVVFFSRVPWKSEDDRDEFIYWLTRKQPGQYQQRQVFPSDEYVPEYDGSEDQRRQRHWAEDMVRRQREQSQEARSRDIQQPYMLREWPWPYIPEAPHAGPVAPQQGPMPTPSPSPGPAPNAPRPQPARPDMASPQAIREYERRKATRQAPVPIPRRTRGPQARDGSPTYNT